MLKIYAVCILVISLQFIERAESVHIGSGHHDGTELGRFLNWFNSFAGSRSPSFRGANWYFPQVEDAKNKDLSTKEMKAIDSIVQEEFLGKLRNLYVSKNRSRFGR